MPLNLHWFHCWSNEAQMLIVPTDQKLRGDMRFEGLWWRTKMVVEGKRKVCSVSSYDKIELPQRVNYLVQPVRSRHDVEDRRCSELRKILTRTDGMTCQKPRSNPLWLFFTRKGKEEVHARNHVIWNNLRKRYTKRRMTSHGSVLCALSRKQCCLGEQVWTSCTNSMTCSCLSNGIKSNCLFAFGQRLSPNANRVLFCNHPGQ